MNGKHSETGTARSRNKRRFRLSLHRFVAILVLGLLVSRIQTSPFFIYEEDGSTIDQPHNSRHQSGSIRPATWRQWLSDHDNSTHTQVSVLKLEPTSLHTDWGCGISMQLLFETRSTFDPIPSFTKAFFKASHADMFHYDAESHLREIKAYYLDQILKTHVVLPCIGYRLDRGQQVQNEEHWSTISKNLECVTTGDTTTTTTASVEGSIMLWMNGIEGVSKERIVESSKQQSMEEQSEAESAMNYALFHYLGACMKSEHNHFSQKRNKVYVAIDNDRCMTPRAIFSNRETVPELHFNRIKLWENLVYERICHIPHHRFPVIRVVRDANGLVSSRLKQALQTDALSRELLESQPEAFDEIDERIHKLAEYILQNCPNGGEIAA